MLYSTCIIKLRLINCITFPVGAYNLAGPGTVTRSREDGRFMIHLTAESILKGGDAEMVMASNDEGLRDRWFAMLHVSESVDFPQVLITRVTHTIA